MDKKKNKTTIDSWTVYYEDNAYNGIIYLRDYLDFSETKVFFEYAWSRGRADFEDRSGYDYTLIKNSDGSYTVARR